VNGCVSLARETERAILTIASARVLGVAQSISENVRFIDIPYDQFQKIKLQPLRELNSLQLLSSDGGEPPRDDGDHGDPDIEQRLGASRVSP
jgi:hypothetical protein